FNGASTRTLYEYELREAYLGFFAGPVDIRLGQQRIAWGSGEFFQPNDVINARDLRDPVLTDNELLRIPQLVARVDIDILRKARVQLVFAPFFIPDRLPFFGENWALIQPGAPALYRTALSLFANSQDTRV